MLDDAADVVTVNGIVKAVALIAGRAAGTWRMPSGHVELDLWQHQSRATAAALQREAAAVEAYLALEFRPTKVHELVTEGSSLEESFLELTP